jgi:hypothetical protein
MRSRLLLALGLTAALTGCVSNATGPRFGGISQAPPAAGQGRVYVLRENVLYLAQAPYIAKPAVAVDGRVIGYLQNGGYLAADVPAGEHALIMGFGSEPTIRGFAVPPGGAAFFETYDKTRVAGSRAFVAGMAGGAIGGMTQALQEQREAEERHEGRIWTLDPVPAPVALQKLQSLVLSE